MVRRHPADVATLTALIAAVAPPGEPQLDRWREPVLEEPVRCGLCGGWTVRVGVCERCSRLFAGST